MVGAGEPPGDDALRPWHSSPEVGSQNHGDVHSTERIAFHHDPTRAERLPHLATPSGVASPDDHPSRVRRAVRVAEEHDVETLAPEHPCRRAGDPGLAGPVEHLDGDAVSGRGHGVGTLARLRWGRWHQQPDAGRQRHHRQRDQDDVDDAATRLFQKRTVGSGRTRPELTMRFTRAWAT